LREELRRQRLGSALFDTQRYCRHLESAYLTMHQRAVRGEQPAGFDVIAIPATPAQASC
jgi:protein O-GlcNAc transferase